MISFAKNVKLGISNLLWYIKDTISLLYNLIPEINFSLWNIPITFSRAFVVFYSVLALMGGWVFSGALAIIFTFLIMHELSHCLAARYFKYKVFEITFYPFAGAAAIENGWYKKPKHEFLIAIAGPLSNIVVACILYPLCYLSIDYDLINQILSFAYYMNMLLATFNLIPIYPMDGGRILHSFVLQFLSKGNQHKDVMKTQVISSLFLLAAVIYFISEWNFIGATLLFVIYTIGWGEHMSILEEDKKLEKIIKNLKVKV